MKRFLVPLTILIFLAISPALARARLSTPSPFPVSPGDSFTIFGTGFSACDGPLVFTITRTCEDGRFLSFSFIERNIDHSLVNGGGYFQWTKVARSEHGGFWCRGAYQLRVNQTVSWPCRDHTAGVEFPVR